MSHSNNADDAAQKSARKAKQKSENAERKRKRREKTKTKTRNGKKRKAAPRHHSLDRETRSLSVEPARQRTLRYTPNADEVWARSGHSKRNPCPFSLPSHSQTRRDPRVCPRKPNSRKRGAVSSGRREIRFFAMTGGALAKQGRRGSLCH